MRSYLSKAGMLIVITLFILKTASAKNSTIPINNDSLKAQLLKDWERAKAYTRGDTTSRRETTLKISGFQDFRVHAISTCLLFYQNKIF